MASTPYSDPFSENPGENQFSEKRDPHTGAPTTERTVAAAHRSIDAIGDHASKREEALRDGVHSSVERYNESQEYLRSRVTTSMERTRNYVREHPLTAAGSAFAAGALFTLIFGRR